MSDVLGAWVRQLKSLASLMVAALVAASGAYQVKSRLCGRLPDCKLFGMLDER